MKNLHRAIYTFKSLDDYKKAYSLLNQGVDFHRPEYEYSRVDSLRQISIPEDKFQLVENLWAKNGIKNYKRSSSEVSFKRAANKVAAKFFILATDTPHVS